MSKPKKLPKFISLHRDGFRVRVRRDVGGIDAVFPTLADAEEHLADKLYVMRRTKVTGQVEVKVTGRFGDLIDKYVEIMAPIKKWSGSKDYHMTKLKADLGDRDVAEFGEDLIVEYGMHLQTVPSRGKKPLGAPGIQSRLSYLVQIFKTCSNRNILGLKKMGGHRIVQSMKVGMAICREEAITGKGEARDRVIKPSELERIKAAHLERTSHTKVDLCAIIDILSIWPIRVGELCKIETDRDIEEHGVWLRQRKHPTKKQTNDELVAMPVVYGNDVRTMLTTRLRFADRPFPYESNECSQYFHYAAKAAGVANIHLHDLRAHAITAMRKMNADYPLIAKISGHKDFTVMAKHYDRLTPEEVSEMLAALQRQAGQPKLKVAA